MLIDLHTHSTASDGTYTPKELVEYAIKSNISHLALTDHDTTDGLKSFLKDANNPIELIPGIEISVSFNKGELHLVGLFIDKEQPDMKIMVQKVKDYRKIRNENMLIKLTALTGKRIKQTDIIDNHNGQLGRTHIAKFLIKNGIAESINDAFNRFLNDSGKLSVPKERIPINIAIETIHKAKGIAILAHPSTLNLTNNELEELIKKYKELGLDGIEVFSNHSPDENKKEYLNLAKKYDMAISGGSDFHGDNSPQKSLGANIPSISLNETLNSLYNKLKLYR